MREVTIVDVDEQYEPPAMPVLNLAVIGDHVFLSIAAYEQTNDTTTLKKLAQMAVGLPELLNALVSSYDSQRCSEARRAKERKEDMS